MPSGSLVESFISRLFGKILRATRFPFRRFMATLEERFQAIGLSRQKAVETVGNKKLSQSLQMCLDNVLLPQIRSLLQA
jgi:hypothetical protein